MRIKLFAFVLFLMFGTMTYAVGPGEVKVIEPVEKVVTTGDVINAGLIGPGQTLSVMVSSKVDTGGKYGQGGNWDNLRAEELPEGWVATFSEYGPNLKINIKAPADTPEGKYHLKLSVNDFEDGEKIGGKVVFYVDVEVKDNVLEVYVTPEKLTVATGAPARYSVKITNPSSASDIFTIQGIGVQRWSFKKDVFIPRNSSALVYYEIVNTDEEVIPILLKVTSKSSERIHAEKGILLTTKSDPYYDMLSIKNGLLLYPPLEFLVYSTLYFFSSFL